MARAPTGTVTFLFTDVEGSTKLWERGPEALSQALARHDEIPKEAIEAHEGHVFKTVGDAFLPPSQLPLRPSRRLWRLSEDYSRSSEPRPDP